METLLAPAALVTTTPGTTWATPFLDELMARVGVDGLVAALRCPNVMASIEEHAEGVRDDLAAKGHALSAEPLAGYGSAVLTAAQSCDRYLPTNPEMINFEYADWYVLRLVAVCLLAEENGCL